MKRLRESPNTCEKNTIQVSKNNKFRKTRSRLGQENPKKEVEPIAPNSEAESKTNILYRNTNTGKKINLKGKIKIKHKS